MKKKQYRQGDVLIEEADLPKNVKLPKKYGHCILAHGEVTGHAHTVNSGRMSTYTKIGELDVAFLVTNASVDVQHQEHGPIPLRRTVHRVVRQREYSPAAIRNVAD